MASLSLRDRSFLEANHPDHEVWAEGGRTCVVIKALPLEPGLQPETSDLLIRLPEPSAIYKRHSTGSARPFSPSA